MQGTCAQCRSAGFRFEGTVRIAPYVERMADLLRRFKFSRAEYLDRYLADLMLAALRQAPWSSEIEAFVPVASHWLRRFTVGPHPVQGLCEHIARQASLPCLSLVRRIRFDRHQIDLSMTERIENVKGAFALTSSADVHGAVLCVVDDVMTSGATLNEVARVLKKAGAQSVYNLILVRAGRQDADLGIA